ncbi:MAG: sugar phosphate nucleotidyltransferase [Candidatus Eisenbacteria bacterium]
MKRECKTAVILAAGGGTRVRTLTSERPKCLMDLGGRRIIDWIFDALAAGGVRDVVMVTGFKAAVLERAIGDGKDQDMRIRYVRNRRWKEPNGISLHAARTALRGGQPFLTLMSDHLLPPGIIRKVARAHTSRCILAVDTDIKNVFDLSDATKVRVRNGVPEAIGKKLRTYNAVDCGLFRFDGRIFTALETAFKNGKKSLSDGVKNLIADGDLEVLPVAPGMTWIDIDTPKAYRHALGDLNTYLSRPGRRRGK